MIGGKVNDVQGRRPLPFLATNVILRFILDDVPEQSGQTARLFERLEAREFTVEMSDTVMFEAGYILHRQYSFTRPMIRERLQPVIDRPAVHLARKECMVMCLDAYVQYPALSLADCLHAAIALQSADATIVSFDLEYRRVAGLTRREPDDMP